MAFRLCCPLVAIAVLLAASTGLAAGPSVVQDAEKKLVTLSDGPGDLVLRLNYDGRCLLDRVTVRGRQVVAPETGVCSAISVAGRWFTTRSGIPTPTVTVAGDTRHAERSCLWRRRRADQGDVDLHCPARPHSLADRPHLPLRRHAGRHVLSGLGFCRHEDVDGRSAGHRRRGLEPLSRRPHDDVWGTYGQGHVLEPPGPLLSPHRGGAFARPAPGDSFQPPSQRRP